MQPVSLTTEALYHQHSADILKYVRTKVKDEDTAKDIVQDIFARVHLNRHTITDGHKTTGWIYAIARNMVTDYFRKNKTRYSEAEDIPCEEETATENQTFEKCLLHFIPKLPAKYSDIIKKTIWGNLSQAEYARLKNISNSGAKSRMQRARQKLLEHYRQCCDFTADVYGNIIDNHCKNSCHS